MKITARASSLSSAAAVRIAASRTVEDAAQIMWTYYRDHKQLLIADIRLYRAGILTQLIAGVAVEDVFAPYFRPPEPARATRRAA